MDIQEFTDCAERLIAEIETVIVGKRTSVEMVLTGLLCQGHILIEDIPGVGKTMLARSLALSIDCDFSRIQFTPDLLPADITGTTIYEKGAELFSFRPGPIFANIVLADEINRATPKSQSALLECMEEFQVSFAGHTYKLPRPFFVIATENPIEYEGTYPLPEAQLDRFLMKVTIGYPEPDEEVEVLQRQVLEHPIETVEPVTSAGEVVEMQQVLRRVHIDRSLQRYAVDIATASRNHDSVQLGASPRGSLALMRCSQGVAALDGRSHIVPDDIKRVAVPALSHRLIIKPDERIRGIGPEDVIEDILEAVEVPVVESEVGS
ncbi:MAG: AAA family ATPase [Armatimonadota bacterium]